MSDEEDDVPLTLLLQKSREKAAAAEKEKQAQLQLQKQQRNSAAKSSSSGKDNKTPTKHEDDKKRKSSSSDDKDSKKMKPSSSSSSSGANGARPTVNVAKTTTSSSATKPSPSTNVASSSGGDKKKNKGSSSRKEEKELAKWTFLGNPEEDVINNMPRQMKHNLVVHVLKRWAYCLDPWPGTLPPAPPGYVPSHTLGVYIGHSTNVLGKIHDARPKEPGKLPSMNSLLTLHSKVLQGLLIKGIEAQLKDLDPEANRRLVKQLKKELKRARKLKPNRIEARYRAEKDRVTGGKSVAGASTSSSSSSAAASSSSSSSSSHPTRSLKPSDTDSQDFEEKN